MKLYAISVLKVTPASKEIEPLICSMATDVSDAGMLHRSSAREFLRFFSRTVAKRATPLSKTQVSEKGRVLYAHSFQGGSLVAIAIADEDYNMRVAFSMLEKIAVQFLDTFRGQWEGVSKDDALTWPFLGETLVKYQDPSEADQLMKIHKDLEETKIIMHTAIEQALERDEKLDHLVGLSADLGFASKGFYGAARKTNSSCCVVA